jgi:hypothetical protein
MSSVLDLFEMVAPKVYIIPDSAYRDYEDKQRQKRLDEMDSAILYYEEQLKNLRARRDKLLDGGKK